MNRGIEFAPRAVGALFVSGIISALSACSGEGGGGTASLFVENVDVAGRTDVARNSPVAVTFSTPIDPASVSVAGFHVRAGSAILAGRVETAGRVVRFFPTVNSSDPNDYTPDNAPPLNGIGFPPATRLELVIVGNGPLSVRDKRGRALALTHTANFSTSVGFLPENPTLAPRIAALPAFDQIPLNADSNPDPRDPKRAPEFDPSRLTVTMRFTEAMDPGRFSPFLTFSIQNVSPGIAGAGGPTLGNITASADATTFVFRPLFTLGDDPDSTEPYLFRIRINGVLESNPTDERALTDLSGNFLEGNPELGGLAGPLVAPVDFFFKTVDKEGEPNFGSFTDEFNSDQNRGGTPADPTTCLWPSDGHIEGAPATLSTRTVDPVDTGFILPQPLTVEGNRMQFLYLGAPDLAGIGAESLVGWEWGPRSNFVFAADYRNVVMSIGHTNASIFNGGLAIAFADNFAGFPSNPTVVFSGDYSVPNSLSSPYFPWPEFETDFEYDGASNICLELDVPQGAQTFQAFRNNSTAAAPARRRYGPAGSATGPFGDNTIYHARFSFIRKRSIGVSRLIDTRTPDPDYTEPIVVSDASRAGSSYALTFRAEDQSPIGLPDGNTVGPFSDVHRIDGRRFFGFRFELNADPFTGVVPRIDSLSLAWKIE